MAYDDQLQRIRAKLDEARRLDADHRVFGSSSHGYDVGPPLSEPEVAAFEREWGITLPPCYRAFVLGVGDGGPGYQHSGAGPYYGIYPLGDGLGDIHEHPEQHIARPSPLHPRMSDSAWSLLSEALHAEESNDTEYEEAQGRVYAGLLPLGSQGCTYLYALVVTGEHRGRVVNLDLNDYKPIFAFEANFLDWYERWLDDVIAGHLRVSHPTWFGYSKGGTEEELLAELEFETELQASLESLAGLSRLVSLSDQGCDRLIPFCEPESPEVRSRALQILARHSFQRARDFIQARLELDDEGCLLALQIIHWYAKDQAAEWAGQVRARLPRIRTVETFRFACCVLDASGTDYAESLLPLCERRPIEIQTQALYHLGQSRNKVRWLDTFALALGDESPRVVHTALQALDGVRDRRLLGAYASILERFPTDEHDILTNLGHRLEELGISEEELLRGRARGRY